MRTHGDHPAGATSVWPMRQVGVSATMTYDERGAALGDNKAGAAFEARSQDEQDRWLCERLRELYATGSFWHISAKLAADRIETLAAERDCALAAFEVELARGTGRSQTQDGPVVNCERGGDGAFVPALVQAPEPASGAGLPLALPPPGAVPPASAATPPMAAPCEPHITDEEIEAVARILCAHSGADPDQPVLYREHKGVRVRSERADEAAGRHSAMPVWKWRFADQARAALEAAASARCKAAEGSGAPSPLGSQALSAEGSTVQAAVPSGG